MSVVDTEPGNLVQESSDVASTRVRVAIVGGGHAGLAAATVLKGRGIFLERAGRPTVRRFVCSKRNLEKAAHQLADAEQELCRDCV
jgi:flavin-dependent dehydrogenase